MKTNRKDLLERIDYLKKEDLEEKVTLQKLKRLYNFKGHDSLLYRFYLTLNLSISDDERAYYQGVIQRLEIEEKTKLNELISP